MNISSSSLFLIFIITTLSFHSTTPTTIHDSSGNTLLTGIPYHILPLLRNSGGGGLTLTRTPKDACPLDVTQEPFEPNHGIPFTFNPIILHEHIVRQAYPISVEVDVTSPCTGSNILKVAAKKEVHKKNKKKKKKHDDDDDDDEKDVSPVNIVTTGGEFNKPESCFQIVEDNMMPGLQSYQIQNCPFKCGATSSSTGDFSCYNVGVVTDADGNRYLGRTDAVFPVVFESSYGGFRGLGKMNTFGQLPVKMNVFR